MIRSNRFCLYFARLVCAGLLLAAVAGCERKPPEAQPELSFETLPDTAGLAAGKPLLRSFEAYRLENGLLRVKGQVDFPDGTRLRVAVKRLGERSTVAMVEVAVQGHAFDSPPMLGDTGPLPVERYRFEISARFTADAQDASVLRATAGGTSLRGPGITRDQRGTATFYLVEEMKR